MATDSHASNARPIRDTATPTMKPKMKVSMTLVYIAILARLASLIASAFASDLFTKLARFVRIVGFVAKAPMSA